MRVLPNCRCGRQLLPVLDGLFVFPGFADEACGLMCKWCDTPVTGFTWDDEQMWTELEMLERGSWPARIEGFIQGQRSDLVIFDDPYPQVDLPENQ